MKNKYDELRKQLDSVESNLSYAKYLHPEERKRTELRLNMMKKEIKTAMHKIYFEELRIKGGKSK